MFFGFKVKKFMKKTKIVATIGPSTTDSKKWKSY